MKFKMNKLRISAIYFVYLIFIYYFGVDDLKKDFDVDELSLKIKTAGPQATVDFIHKYFIFRICSCHFLFYDFLSRADLELDPQILGLQEYRGRSFFG